MKSEKSFISKVGGFFKRTGCAIRDNIHTPGVGFIILSASFVLLIVAFIMAGMTFDAFHYDQDKWVIALLVIAIWCYIGAMIGTLVNGNKPVITDILYWLAIFAVTIALIKFLIPCLSPIGIYFTVHNMGDVEANAIGVPRSIVTIVFFVLAIITLITSTFFNMAKKSREVRDER